jgi:hypothetical protein
MNICLQTVDERAIKESWQQARADFLDEIFYELTKEFKVSEMDFE